MLDEVTTAVGTPNIALIKYWGKRDERLILPQNSSVSMTLDESLNTKTSVLFTKTLKSDVIYIDGKKQDLKSNEIRERFTVINHLRKIAKTNARALIVSRNSFPAASGLASSASGIATLVYAASKALELNLNLKRLSIIARVGSGSACRSMFGGVVKWNAGKRADGLDSYAEQIVGPEYWPDLMDILAIVSREQKKVSSRAGMKQTVSNSILYRCRHAYVEDAVSRMVNAVKKRDFEKLASLAMQDSNNMHATMLDTRPPLFYLNDVSREIIYSVEELNMTEGKNVAAYTFDAGPNAHIIVLRKNKNKIKKLLENVGGVKKVIEAGIGSGPRVAQDSLIDAARMKPL
jgi:diphosphomevalonate decarboxylase